MLESRVKLISIIETWKLKHKGHIFFFFLIITKVCPWPIPMSNVIYHLGPHNICGTLYDLSSWGNYIGTINFLVVRFYEGRERERERETWFGLAAYIHRESPWWLHLHCNLNSYYNKPWTGYIWWLRARIRHTYTK